jgi:hypothetical protein
MTGVFPDYPAPVIGNTGAGTELTMMRWGMPPPPRTGGPPVHFMDARLIQQFFLHQAAVVPVLRGDQPPSDAEKPR